VGEMKKENFEGLCLLGGFVSVIVGGFVLFNYSGLFGVVLIAGGIIAFSYGAYKELKYRGVI
jgi:hypothetical protein